MPLSLSAARIMQRCEELARHSETAHGLTRVFLSPEHRAAGERVLAWMRDAGMAPRIDAMGNVIGRLEGDRAGLPALLLGSHLDSVRNAGKYDGMLGVVTAIECVDALAKQRPRLPFATEVIAFGDEEGVRFGATLLGSRAVAGTFEASWLEIRDAAGVTLAQAMRDFGLDPDRIPGAAHARENLLGYVELHIEQGPVLEAEGLPVGVVTAINGFSRLRITLQGQAGHAGTVPMELRRDALAAAAECVLAVERAGRSRPELVATVGRIEAAPGAINVIPGETAFTLDIRAPADGARESVLAGLLGEMARISERRKVKLGLERLQDQGVTPCAPWLMKQLEHAVQAEGFPVRRLPSGAGHDGMALAAIADVAMLFVRCKGGISHHPAESITEEDAAAGARVLGRFLEDFTWQH